MPAAPLLLKVLAPLVVMGVVAACQKALSEARMRPLGTLAGTEWGFAGDGRFVAFRAGGEIAGSGGCNSFFGQYTQDGARLTVGPLASTKKACPPATMDREAAFLRMLERVRRVEATHAELVLFGADDAVLARLRRKDWD